MNDLPEHEIVVTFFKSSGPGGQKKNKTLSGVRIKHLPTGVIVTATEERSQLANRQKAVERLKQRLASRQRRRKPRIPTAPGRKAVERRLGAKTKRSATKRLRQKPSASEGD